MFKIIAALAFVAGLLQRISDWLRDVRERVVGAVLSATTEKLVSNNAEFKAIIVGQQAKAEAATESLKEDLRIAHKRYSDTLTRIGTSADAAREVNNVKAAKLRETHSKARSLLTGGAL